MSEGLRYNDKKPRMDLLPWDALLALADHFRVGAEKYPARNWEHGLKWNEDCAASLARHLAAWSRREDVDPENGSYHDVAMAWNAIALVAFRLRGIGEDDRPNKSNDPRQADQACKDACSPYLPDGPLDRCLVDGGPANPEDTCDFHNKDVPR